MFRPFPRSGMAIWGRLRAPKWLEKAINGPIVGISRRYVSKPVGQLCWDLFPGLGLLLGGAIGPQKTFTFTKQKKLNEKGN